jgi:hypothetical protein
MTLSASLAGGTAAFACQHTTIGGGGKEIDGGFLMARRPVRVTLPLPTGAGIL